MDDSTHIRRIPLSPELTRWFAPVIAAGSRACADNLTTRMAFLRHKDVELPLTCNEEEWDNSWICSPFTHFISYAIEEIGRAAPAPIAWPAIRALGWWGRRLQRHQFNQVVMVNNTLFSTCPWPRLSRRSAAPVLRCLRENFPDHARVFRSLNHRECPEFMEGLHTEGLILLPSRQVWWFDPEDPAVAQSRDFKADKRLLNRGDLTVVSGREFSDRDYEQGIQLYRQLYLRKYSMHNPRYHSGWLKHLQESGILEITGLRSGDGTLLGIEGRVESHGTLTSPLVGYDTTLPPKLGLYRRLAVIPVIEARRKGIPLNLSAGVGPFKARRGGKPVMEFLAVDVKGLPASRSRPWKILAALSRHLLAPFARSMGL